MDVLHSRHVSKAHIDSEERRGLKTGSAERRPGDVGSGRSDGGQHAKPPLPPLLRWAGSKSQVVRQLAAFAPSDAKRYVEPFAGSACLFFHLGPQRALLADINGELITTYAVLVDDPLGVDVALQALGPADSKRYYEVRSLRPERLGSAARAARFLYLNRYCFNGLYRTNQLGDFNVPYGALRSGQLPTLEQLETYATRLADAELETADYVETCRKVVEGDFVYLDPPYAVKKEWRRGRHYTDDAFAVDDLAQLATVLGELNAIGLALGPGYSQAEHCRVGI